MQRMTMGHIHWTKKISFTLTVSFFFSKLLVKLLIIIEKIITNKSTLSTYGT